MSDIQPSSAPAEKEYKLYHAVQDGNFELASTLAYNHGDEMQPNGETPLYIAAKQGDVRMMQLLLQSNAYIHHQMINPEIPEPEANTWIESATQMASAVSTFILPGDNPPWFNPLRAAVENSQIDAVKLLLKHNAPVTPLLMQIARDKNDVAVLLRLEHAYKFQQMLLQIKRIEERKDEGIFLLGYINPAALIWAAGFSFLIDVLSGGPDRSKEYAIEKLRLLADEDNTKVLDQAIATLIHIVKFDVMSATLKERHPTINKFELNKAAKEAYHAFTANPNNPGILLQLTEKAEAFNKIVSVAHARDSFFGKHLGTQCDIEKRVEALIEARPTLS